MAGMGDRAVVGGAAANAWDVYLRPPITEADVQHEMDRLRHTG